MDSTTPFRDRMILTCFACAAVLLAAGPAFCDEQQDGDDDEPATPGVGDTAPDFTLTSIVDVSTTLSELTDQGPVVLLVLRGYPGYQCPICTRQVGDYIRHAEAFAERGAKVVLIYPGPSDELKQRAEEFLGDDTLPDNFTFLLDPDYTFTNLYNLRWDEERETAYPSTFIIDTARTVTYEHISHSHGDRTKAEDIIEKLDEASGNASEEN